MRTMLAFYAHCIEYRFKLLDWYFNVSNSNDTLGTRINWLEFQKWTWKQIWALSSPTRPKRRKGRQNRYLQKWVYWCPKGKAAQNWAIIVRKAVQSCPKRTTEGEEERTDYYDYRNFNGLKRNIILCNTAVPNATDRKKVFFKISSFYFRSYRYRMRIQK